MWDDYNAQASKNPTIASKIPKCKSRLVSASQPAAGINWINQLDITNKIPRMGNKPLRCARYSESLSISGLNFVFIFNGEGFVPGEHPAGDSALNDNTFVGLLYSRHLTLVVERCD
jgi:hypothetical protein